MHLLPLLAIGLFHLLPRPQSVTPLKCSQGAAGLPRSASRFIDDGALDLINERWRALGLPPLVRSSDGRSDIVVKRERMPAQGYDLLVSANRTTIAAGDNDGIFYAMMTLAQLPQRDRGQWRLPCVHIADKPALRWRILSDDISRGPLPTMRYFMERIRTIAAFKMNGYSPYMEQVFLSPTDPLPAPLDGLTPAQLHELAVYSKRFHVAFIPEQQTFAHMHETLRLEQYANMAELPHAFLLAPNVPGSMAYVSRLIQQELEAVPDPPFFHIGSDETATLGEGQTQDYVAQRGRSRVYADHVVAMHNLVRAASPNTHIMLWDDGIESDPTIMRWIPRDTVIINWHYGEQKSFWPFIDLIASGGFRQMVAPGASNWNEIYPDLNTALSNENLFITQGKERHVLGLFQTIWHDDGETLFETTWYPVIYAATSAWESGSVSPTRFRSDFPQAFFGTSDSRYGDDVMKLADILTALEAPAKYETTNRLFWSPLDDAFVAEQMSHVDLRRVRLESEDVEAHLARAHPPLHANAAGDMFLAARRYDLIGRKFQILHEIETMYADAEQSNASASVSDPPDEHVIRDLMWCKYWLWELRDAYEELAPLYAEAWRYENRDSHLASNLERYHLMAQDAIRSADFMDRALYEDYLPSRKLPALSLGGNAL